MKLLFLAFALAVSSFVLPFQVAAQWTRCTGIPDTVQLRVPLKDGNRLMAGDNGGYYSSSDGGLSWAKQTPATLPADFYMSDIMRFHRFLFGYGFDGVYRSADSGLTWQPISATPTAAMYGMGGMLLSKNNSNDSYSNDSGSSWINTGGASGTDNVNTYTRALLYPYVSVDSLLFLEFGVLGFYRSIDSGRTFSDFGLNAVGHYNSFTQIDGKLFAAADLMSGTSIKNVYRSGTSAPAWAFTPNNADGQFFWLSGTDHHMLLGSTQALPYYSTNYLTSAMSWDLMDTAGLHLASYLTPGGYYSISFVKDYGDIYLMGVNYYNGSPLFPVKNVYFTRKRDDLFPTAVDQLLAGEKQTEFNVTTLPAGRHLEYSLKLPVSSRVRISLTDISGNRRMTILDKVMDAKLSVGEYPVNDLPQGTYLVVLETPSTKIVRRVVLTH